MKIIVGLGNPGPEYADTRHNIGWKVADAFASKFRIEFNKHEKNAMTGQGRVAGGSVMVALASLLYVPGSHGIPPCAEAWV